jgi:hypothetical protein
MIITRFALTARGSIIAVVVAAAPLFRRPPVNLGW